MAKKEETEAKGPPEKPQADEEHPDFKFLVRIENTDIDGHRPLYLGLTTIKGIGRRTSIRIIHELQLDRNMRIGDLKDEEVEAIQKAVEDIHVQLPNWMMNRQKDFDTGDDMHIVGTEVQVARRDDINRLKKIRSYKGIRHERGHKVRGQRMKSNGRTGLVLGVSRKRK
jgi:small subunit ribosomal protein S13